MNTKSIKVAALLVALLGAMSAHAYDKGENEFLYKRNDRCFLIDSQTKAVRSVTCEPEDKSMAASQATGPSRPMPETVRGMFDSMDRAVNEHLAKTKEEII